MCKLQKGKEARHAKSAPNALLHFSFVCSGTFGFRARQRQLLVNVRKKRSSAGRIVRHFPLWSAFSPFFAISYLHVPVPFSPLVSFLSLRSLLNITELFSCLAWKMFSRFSSFVSFSIAFHEREIVDARGAKMKGKSNLCEAVELRH